MLPIPRVGSVRPNEDIIFLICDEVDSAQVHGFVAAVEANVALFGLSRVARRPYHQPLDVRIFSQHAFDKRLTERAGSTGDQETAVIRK